MTLVNPLFTVTDAEPTNRYTSKGVASVHYLDRHDVVAERRRGHVDLVQKNAIAKHWNGKITPTWTLRANPRDRVPRASSDAVRTVLTATKVIFSSGRRRQPSRVPRTDKVPSTQYE